MARRAKQSLPFSPYEKDMDTLSSSSSFSKGEMLLDNTNNNSSDSSINEEVDNYDNWNVQDVRNDLRKATLELSHYSLKLASKWYV